jgi:hypothetical protein
VLRRLAARWGSQLPDVELLLESSDAPLADPGERERCTLAFSPDIAAAAEVSAATTAALQRRLPVLRHCKTAGSSEIAVWMGKEGGGCTRVPGRRSLGTATACALVAGAGAQLPPVHHGLHPALH